LSDSPKASRRGVRHTTTRIIGTGTVAFLFFMFMFLLSDSEIAFAGLVLLAAITAYLHRSSPWYTRIASALAITTAHAGVGVIEILHTRFVPPIQLMVMSTSAVCVGSVIATVAGGAVIGRFASRASGFREYKNT
jgi:hypothetical protein